MFSSNLKAACLFFFDAASTWQFLFQDPASPIMEGIVEFHHDIMFILLFIVFFVLYMLCATVDEFNLEAQLNSNKSGVTRIEKLNVFTHNTALEVA